MKRLLPLFVMLSAGAHVLAMAMLGGPSTAVPFAGQSLIVSLLAGPSQHSQSLTVGAASSNSNGQHSVESKPETRRQQSVADGVLQESADTPARAAAGMSTPATQATTPAHGQKLLSEINRLLTASFVYPPIARRLGQQGRVVVTVNLGGQGQIQQAELFESSGYRVLDQAALRSIRDIRQAPQLIQWLNGRPARIRVPVVYRLAEA